jgi:hypothetical protein
MDVGSNKSRKDARAVVSLVARYRSPSTFEYVQEGCCDVSVGGMFIQSPDPAAPGTLLKLECEADKDGNRIRGVARVVWLRREANEYGPSGMGVKFVKLETGSKEIITRIVEQLAAAGVEAQSISSAPEARGKPPARRVTPPPTAADLSASAPGAARATEPVAEEPKRKSDWPPRPSKPAPVSNAPAGASQQLERPPPPAAGPNSEPPPPAAAAADASMAMAPEAAPVIEQHARENTAPPPVSEKPAVAARERTSSFGETLGAEAERSNTRRVFGWSRWQSPCC